MLRPLVAVLLVASLVGVAGGAVTAGSAPFLNAPESAHPDRVDADSGGDVGSSDFELCSGAGAGDIGTTTKNSSGGGSC